MEILDYRQTSREYRTNDNYACDYCRAITPLLEMYEVTIEDENETSGTSEMTICGSCLADNKRPNE